MAALQGLRNSPQALRSPRPHCNNAKVWVRALGPSQLSRMPSAPIWLIRTRPAFGRGTDSRLSRKEEFIVCSILNTAEYCLETTAQVRCCGRAVLFLALSLP